MCMSLTLITFTASEGGNTTVKLPSSPSQANNTTTSIINSELSSDHQRSTITLSNHQTVAESEAITITLAAAVAVLVSLLAVVLIIVCLAHKKRSATHQQRCVQNTTVCLNSHLYIS